MEVIKSILMLYAICVISPVAIESDNNLKNDKNDLEIIKQEEIDAEKFCTLDYIQCDDNAVKITTLKNSLSGSDVSFGNPTLKSGKNAFFIEVSSYSEIDSCHYPNSNGECLMASGKPAYIGAVACPRRLFGKTIEILGQQYKCEDKLSLQYDNRIDIWQGYGQNAYEKSIQWGVKNLEVKIIK